MSENWSPGVIMRCSLRDSTFSHFSRILTSDGWIDKWTHDNSVKCASLVLHGKSGAIGLVISAK